MGTDEEEEGMKLPEKAGAVIRCKYYDDGVYQYRVAVLSMHPDDYEQGLVWHYHNWRLSWSQEKMQYHVNDTDWGEWEIVHPGDDE